MDKFLTSYKRKSSNNENTDSIASNNSNITSNIEQDSKSPKTIKYDSFYLSLGFTSSIINGLERPTCLFCTKVLAIDNLRPGKLKRHLSTMHSEYHGKPIKFFQRKLDEYNKQKQTLKKK